MNINMWRNEHISDPRVIFHEISKRSIIQYNWFYNSHTEVHTWPTERISGQRVLDLVLSIYTHWLLQRDLHFEHSLHIDCLLISAIQNCTCDMNIFLTQKSLLMKFRNIILQSYCPYLINSISIMNFLHMLIASFWCDISYTEVHILPTEHISCPNVVNHELPMHTHSLLLVISQSEVTSEADNGNVWKVENWVLFGQIYDITIPMHYYMDDVSSETKSM